ncbi:MAG: LacI family DNA-binding transcriptional regulator [bacterium]
MASLKDIAAHSGVSIRTVARVLKGDDCVRATTRERVLLAAQEMGYTPNRAARSLKTGSSFEIIALIGNTDELELARLGAFQQQLSAHGYAVHVVFQTEWEAPSETAKRIASWAPLGLALFHSSRTKHEEVALAAQARNIRCVLIDSGSEVAGAGHVRIGRSRGVYDGVNYLLEKGCRRIAYAGANCASRVSAYRRALSESGIAERIFLSGSSDQYEAGREALSALLQAPEIDAVQAYSDIMASGMLHEAHLRRVRIPEDLAIIGFDNRLLCVHCWPPLTTVAHPNEAVGEAAAELLLSAFSPEPKSDIKDEISLPTQLVVRASA